LQGTCEKYGLPGKLDVVKTEYWEKGIDTDQIPQDILKEYLLGDLDATQQVFEKQDKLLVENQRKLFSLQCQDLLVLQEMEFNGIYINVKEALRCADEEDAKAREVEKQLQQGYENIPINWDSNDHLSCYLYGGTIVDTVRLPIGVYKSGAKIGQPRYKLVDYEYKLARMVEPLRGSELKKEGYYATNDPTLRSLKATKEARRRVNLILERAKSVKLSGTYYRGLPKLIETMDWPSGILHGQFNQCVAATGRLSSSKPNLQNFAAEVKTLLETRYG
jgi:DNA polymerase I-like protein with 3'-5' exonuclease and polymerase domains